MGYGDSVGVSRESLVSYLRSIALVGRGFGRDRISRTLEVLLYCWMRRRLTRAEVQSHGRGGAALNRSLTYSETDRRCDGLPDYSNGKQKRKILHGVN